VQKFDGMFDLQQRNRFQGIEDFQRRIFMLMHDGVLPGYRKF
jgi:hypothetical protein